MSEISPAVRALSERVVSGETHAHQSTEALAAQLESVFSRLQDVTANVIGELGYLALMDRILRRARGTYPWLPTASEAEPRFPRSEWLAPVETVGAEVAKECATALFAGVLALIASFIGEDFTFRLARRAWGDETISPDGSDTGET